MQKPGTPGRKLQLAGAVLAALLAGYALAGFVAVPRLVASLAKDEVRARYGRELAIGAVRFNPFALRLEVDDLALPDADGRPLAGFRHLVVDLGIDSLWRRALAFDAIRVDGLAVEAVRRANGQLNLADLAPEPDPAAAAADEPLPRLVIDQLELADGRVRFEDRARPEPYVAELKPLTFRLTNFSTYVADGERYELDATLFDTSRFAWRGTLKTAPFASDGEFTLADLPLPRIAAFLGDALRLEVTRGTASLRGRYRFAEQPSGPDVVVESGQLDLADLAIRDRGESIDYVDLDRVVASGIRLSLAESRASIGEVSLDGGTIQAWLTPSGELKRSGIFDPLVTEATAGRAATATTAASADPAWQVSVPRISVRNLALSLEDEGLTPAPVFTLKPLDLTITGYSTAPGSSVEADLSATVNDAGRIRVLAKASLDTFATRAEVSVDALPLALAQPYIGRETSLTLVRGLLAANGVVTFEEGAPGAAGAAAPRIGFTGDVTVDGLRTVDNALREDFVTWERLRLGAIEYSSVPGVLRIRDVDARSPYARVIIGPDGTTNLQAVLAGPGATAAPVPGPTLSPGTPPTTALAVAPPPGAGQPSPPPLRLRIGTVRVANGSARFADLTTRPNFAIGIEKLKGTVTGLSTVAASRAKVELDGEVDRYSPVAIRGEVNPLAAETYLDMALTFRNVELTSFTPYSGRFAGYAIRQGKLSADLNYQVTDRKLDADHKFVVDQLELGDKVESPDAVGLPLKLAVALLKDRNGVIDLDLPVTGDLDDPKFRVGPIIWKVFVNLITKAATAPFALLGRLVGGGEELNRIGFPAGAADPGPDEAAKLGSLAKALAERPGLRLSVPAVYSRAADGPALKRAALERALVPADDGPGYAAISADPALHLRLLTARYRAVLGKDAELPPLADGAPATARIPALEAALLDREEVADAGYFDLAKARAEAVQARILDGTGVDPARVFLTAPAEGKVDGGAVVMELALE
jgi:uncharacterized protein involved in outer membrane biogenesis